MQRTCEGAVGRSAAAVPRPTRPAPRRTSVVMPVRNAAETLAEQLEALASQTYTGDWELVVADNGSRDATRRRIAEAADRLPTLHVVDAARPRGISTARNRGVAAATGDLLLFCDGDDVVAPDWIEQMVRAARDGDLVGGRLDPTRLNPPDLRRSRPPPQDGGLARAHDHLPYGTGASLGVWADVMAALGGFDERFRTCGDDVDLSWRAQAAGHRLVHAPAAVTHYRYRTSLARAVVQALRYGVADSMLARRHRHHLPHRPRLRRHVRPLRDLPQLVQGPHARRRWVWGTALRVGALLGVLHPRTRRLGAVPPRTPHGTPAATSPPPTPPLAPTGTLDERSCS